MNAALHERVIGGKRDLRSVGNAGERDAIGTIELTDEAACRLDGGLAPSRGDARSIDDDHDEPAAHRVRVARVRRLAGFVCRLTQLDLRWNADELYRRDRTRTAVHAQLEVCRGQTGDGVPVTVDGADVYLDDVNRRFEPLNGRRRLRRLKEQRECETKRKSVRAHNAEF
jgi:hypothetical protein